MTLLLGILFPDTKVSTQCKLIDTAMATTITNPTGAQIASINLCLGVANLPISIKECSGKLNSLRTTAAFASNHSNETLVSNGTGEMLAL